MNTMNGSQMAFVAALCAAFGCGCVHEDRAYVVPGPGPVPPPVVVVRPPPPPPHHHPPVHVVVPEKSVPHPHGPAAHRPKPMPVQPKHVEGPKMPEGKPAPSHKPNVNVPPAKKGAQPTVPPQP